MLNPIQQYQYSTPVFIIPKKEWTVGFITNYHRLNQILVRNPYPLPIIGNKTNHMEGLKYVISLDINMVYYTIRLLPASQDMTMIVTSFVKFEYNRLPMGMCASGYIFQDKLDDLLIYIKGVKTFVGDVLVLIKERLCMHI